MMGECLQNSPSNEQRAQCAFMNEAHNGPLRWSERTCALLDGMQKLSAQYLRPATMILHLSIAIQFFWRGFFRNTTDSAILQQAYLTFSPFNALDGKNLHFFIVD